MRKPTADLLRILLLACCFWAWPAQALEHLRLQLNWLHQFEFAGYYAALEKGFYREAGLDVSIAEGGPETIPVQEVLNGRADVGVGSSGILLDRIKHPELIVLGVIFQHSPAVLLSLRSSGIQKLADLQGKRLMDSPNAGDVMAMLKLAGVDEKSLRRVSHEGSPAELVAGKADTMIAYSTNEPYVLEEMGIPYVVFSPRSVGIDFYGDNFFTTQSVLASKRDAVAKFREASLRGWQYALTHKEEMVELIISKYSRHKSRDALLFEAQQSQLLIQADLVDLGYQSQVRWDSIAASYAELGELDVRAATRNLMFDPSPAIDTTRLWLALGSFILISLVLFIISLTFGRLNRKLRHEIAERKLAEAALLASQERFRTLFETVPDALLVVDEAGRVVTVNKSFEGLFGVSQASVVGLPIETFIPARFHAVHAIHFKEYLHAPGKGLLSRQGLSAVNAQGHEFPVEISLGPIETEEGRSFICTLRDITERCAAEAELLQHRDRLQELVEAQTADLRMAKEVAESANRSKDAFLSNISHELRTPMHGILSMAKIGFRKTAGEPELSKWHDMFSHVVSSAERMQLLVDDLLEVSNINSSRDTYKLSPNDLRTLCEKAVERMNPLAYKKNITLQLDGLDSAPMMCDGSRLGRVLRQLIDNSIKFSPEAQTIEIKLEEGSSQSTWQVSVVDRGPGIPESELLSIFESFVQGSHTTTGAGGKGLGLTLCRQVIEHHGGTIQAANREGGGAILRFTVPRNIAD